MDGAGPGERADRFVGVLRRPDADLARPVKDGDRDGGPRRRECVTERGFDAADVAVARERILGADAHGERGHVAQIDGVHVRPVVASRAARFVDHAHVTMERARR